MSTQDQIYWGRCRDELKETLAEAGFSSRIG